MSIRALALALRCALAALISLAGLIGVGVLAWRGNYVAVVLLLCVVAALSAWIAPVADDLAWLRRYACRATRDAEGD